MSTTTKDIIRYAGDTYPNKTTISIGSVPITITDWDIMLRYRNSFGDLRIIDCIITNEKEGKVSIYPHDRGENDYPLEYSDFVTDQMEDSGMFNPNTNSLYVSNQCWGFDDAGKEFPFSIIRKRKFQNYEEIMTHNVGVIKLLERV